MQDGESMNRRVGGYDLIRSLAILVVFLGHVITKQETNRTVLLIFQSLSPGLTMSLLGFISAALLSSREYDFGEFLARRFIRIYISLILCLCTILIIYSLLGKLVLNQHTLLHFMGLSAFFDIFIVNNKAMIGSGLWFITVIVVMYLLLPLLQKLFKHPQGFYNLIAVIVSCTILNFLMYGTSSIWNVVISFSVGVYLVGNHSIGKLTSWSGGLSPLFSACAALLAVSALATAKVLPYETRGLLFAIYPLTFVPLLFAVSRWLPSPVIRIASFFAGFSYEFYILHFYFINNLLFRHPLNLYQQIAVSFTVTCVLAYLISRLASKVGKQLIRHLLKQNANENETA